MYSGGDVDATAIANGCVGMVARAPDFQLSYSAGSLPLIFGAAADRHVGPVRVLRWIALATAAAMALVCTGIKQGWNPWLVLALGQKDALAHILWPSGTRSDVELHVGERKTVKEPN